MEKYFFTNNSNILEAYSLSKSYISQDDILEYYKEFWGK